MGVNSSKINAKHPAAKRQHVEYPSSMHPDYQVKNPEQLACFAVKFELPGSYTTPEEDTDFFADWTAKYYLNDIAYIDPLDTIQEINEKLDIARKIIKENGIKNRMSEDTYKKISTAINAYQNKQDMERFKKYSQTRL
jgi:hypothetical protein